MLPRTYCFPLLLLFSLPGTHSTLFFSFSSVQFSCSIMSNYLRPHGLQHTRPPCPSPTPRACSNSGPLSRWCCSTISFSVVPFSSHLQSFPASGSFQKSQLFASGGQSIGISASASVLPMNTQDWSPLEWTGWILANSFSLANSFYKKLFLFIYLSLVVLGLCCCTRAFSSCSKWGLLSSCGVQASHCGGFFFIAKHGL